MTLSEVPSTRIKVHSTEGKGVLRSLNIVSSATARFGKNSRVGRVSSGTASASATISSTRGGVDTSGRGRVSQEGEDSSVLREVISRLEDSTMRGLTSSGVLTPSSFTSRSRLN